MVYKIKTLFDAHAEKCARLDCDGANGNGKYDFPALKALR